MRTKLIFILIFMLTMVLIVINKDARANDYGEIRNVKYVRNYDGDTITCNIEGLHPIIGEDIGIRVNGIDTPEIRGHKERGYQYHHKAVEAKILVEKLCRGTNIVLKDVSRGKYFRIVADVYCNNINISEILLDKELAIPYSGSGSKF